MSDQIKQSELAPAVAEARAGSPLRLARLAWPGVVLDTHQVDMLSCGLSGSFAQLFAKGCTASGKTAGAGMLGVLWYLLNPTSKIIITSQRYDHARDVLFGELATWFRQCRIALPGELGRGGIFHSEQHYVTIANPQTGEGFSGQHGPATLFLFDEATAIPEEYFDLATTQAKLIVCMANPRTLSGFFRRAFPADAPNETRTVPTGFGDRRCITIDGKDCLNVIEGREVIPGQLSRRKYEGLCSHPDPRWAEIFAHGRFPDEDAESQLILGSWFPRHQEAWKADMIVEAFGLDVADSDDGDSTCLAAGGGEGCVALHVRRKADTMATTGWVISTARAEYRIELTEGRVPIVVDCDGIGRGVADRLAELGCWVIRFRGAVTANDPKTYQNKRAEGYGELARYLDPDGLFADYTWALPADPYLTAELAAPERIYASDGVRFRITPKTRASSKFTGETLKEKLGRSPDRADAVVYLFTGVMTLRYIERFEDHGVEYTFV